jgi:hypothetical protein
MTNELNTQIDEMQTNWEKIQVNSTASSTATSTLNEGNIFVEPSTSPISSTTIVLTPEEINLLMQKIEAQRIASSTKQ